MAIELVPLLLVGPVLIAAAYCDLRHMRIPNLLAVIAVALFILSAPLFLSAGETAMRLISAGTVLTVGFLLFALGVVGGGDVKIFAALLLFIPSQTISVFLLLFSAAMVVGIAVVLTLRAVPAATATGWASLQRTSGFPMGISIAMAGLAHPVVLLSITT